MKAFYLKGNAFVAIKKINAFEKVRLFRVTSVATYIANIVLVRHVQDKRHQMMNDVRALCDAPHIPGLVDFVGAYHESESGQVPMEN